MQFSHAGAHLAWWRALIFGAFALTVALVQRYATLLARSRYVGLAAAACFALNPTAASVVCWLSAANLGLCALGLLVYLQSGQRVIFVPMSGRRVALQLTIALSALLFALGCHELSLLGPLMLVIYQRLWVRDEKTTRHARSLHAGSLLCVGGYAAFQLLAHGERLAYRAADQPRWLLSASAMRYFVDNALLWLWPWGRFGVLLSDAPAAHVAASAWCWLLALGAFALCYRLRHRHRHRIASWSLAWVGSRSSCCRCAT